MSIATESLDKIGNSAGALPSARIGDFCTTGSGGTPSRSQMARYYAEGTIPWVKSGELREKIITETSERVTEAALRETNIKVLPPGTLLLAMYGATVGRLGMLGVPATTNQAVCHIIPDPLVADVRYLFRSLSAQVPLLVARGVGGAQPNISQGIIKNLVVSLPPLAEQRRIAEVLDHADALRAKRRAAIAQLDTLTQSIFLDMFGDPATNPNGWPVETLGSQVKSVRYGTGSPPQYVPAGVPFIRATDVKRGVIVRKDLRFISEEDAEGISKCRVSFGDLIIVRSGVNTGECAMVPRAYHGASAAFDLIVELTHCDAVFFNLLINSAYGRRYLAPLTRRAAQPHLNSAQLKALTFFVPPTPLKELFVARVEAIDTSRHHQLRSLVHLDELFASLQHRAFRGEL